MMGDRGGHREQTSDPPDCAGRAELIFAVLAAAAATAAGLLCAYEMAAGAYVSRGVYGVLAALMCIGGVGWTVVWSVARAEARVRQTLLAAQLQTGGQVVEVRAELAGLSSAARRLSQQVARLSAQRVYAVQEQTVPRQPPVKPGRTEYWQVYTDVLQDLGGLEGRPPPEP